MSNTPLFPKVLLELDGYEGNVQWLPLYRGLDEAVSLLATDNWEFVSSEDMYGLPLQEVESLAHFVEIAEMLKKYGASYAAYLASVGIEGNEEDFIEHYLGEHPDKESAAIAALLLEFPTTPLLVVDFLDSWEVGRWVERSKKYAIEQLAGSCYLFSL